MLKYYFRALLLFGSVILFFAFIGCLIPRSFSFTAELAIAGKPEAIFAQLNSLENWPNWSRQFNPAEIVDLKHSSQHHPDDEPEDRADQLLARDHEEAARGGGGALRSHLLQVIFFHRVVIPA